MRITDQQVAAAYGVAKRVYLGELRRGQGVRELVDLHGLNEATAGDFIYDYRQLIEGREFHRAMSSAAMRYFIGNIEAELGVDGLEMAIQSLRAHIVYYERISGATMKSLRAVAEDGELRLIRYRTKLSPEDSFDQKVANAMRDSSTNRLMRISSANRFPEKIVVQTVGFARSPDVVAEVLIRAAGYCELCKQQAPFFRAKDNTPYLEVHHVVQLAKGGEDSVENALALCPNCHRQEHFGIKQPN
ncbi:MAG: HNH endonuclease signature motif containing protein [Azonexus sp.]|nr:HNH endonuclease signature motif containing protein [Azonexus sp.]